MRHVLGAGLPIGLAYGRMTDRFAHMTEEVIVVALLDESVEVWRPVRAEREQDNIFRIADQPYDRARAWSCLSRTARSCTVSEAFTGMCHCPGCRR